MVTQWSDTHKNGFFLCIVKHLTKITLFLDRELKKLFSFPSLKNNKEGHAWTYNTNRDNM